MLEELGRPDEAAQAYKRFVELWQDADSIFEPKVEEGRERVEALSDS